MQPASEVEPQFVLSTDRDVQLPKSPAEIDESIDEAQPTSPETAIVSNEEENEVDLHFKVSNTQYICSFRH